MIRRRPATSDSRTRRTRIPRRGGGFTLLELIAVVVIAAILAAVSVPSLNAMSDSRKSLARNELVRDLTFARQRAVATGGTVWIVFDVAENSYSILAEDAGRPGLANARVIEDPATGAAFSRTFGSKEFAGVHISRAEFDGDSAVGFDWMGRPLNASESDLVGTGRVELSGGMMITVTTESGRIE